MTSVVSANVSVSTVRLGSDQDRCTVHINVVVADSLGIPLCNQTTGLLIAFATAKSWRSAASSKNAVQDASPSFALPAFFGAFRIAVVLAFEEDTLRRGNPFAPFCKYKEIFTIDAMCDTETPLGAGRPPSSRSIWQNVSGVWQLGVGEGVGKVKEEPLSPHRVLFWGDDALQVLFQVLSRLYGVTVFKGDRKAKHYVSREISLHTRYSAVQLGRINATFYGNTEPLLKGKPTLPCKGLTILRHEAYREHLRRHIFETQPTAVIVQSGVADLCVEYEMNVEVLARVAVEAAVFWHNVTQGRQMRIILPTTVATAGIGLCHRFHASRLIWWDTVRVAAFRKVFGPRVHVVDLYSLTLPFHLNNDFSDGTTYGLQNIRGNLYAQRADFPKDSRFLAGKRYDPAVGEALARLLLQAAIGEGEGEGKWKGQM